jgi:hypothetical protein
MAGSRIGRIDSRRVVSVWGEDAISTARSMTLWPEGDFTSSDLIPDSLLGQPDGLTLQIQAAKQLGICSHDDGRSTHRDGAHTHGEIDPPAHEKTSGDRNRNQIIGCRPNEVLDHLSVSSA